MASALDLAARVARDLRLPGPSVEAVLGLMQEGATVPFVARYRKEQTGALDEVKIRSIVERAAYVGELEARRDAILQSIRDQGALTEALEQQVAGARTKAQLEDVYAPYRPKRKTRAAVAREKGLAPLAGLMRAQGAEAPTTAAAAFVSAERGVATAEDALAGARDIVAEEIADTASVRALVRKAFGAGVFVSERVQGKGDDPTKYELYYAHKEPVQSIPSHRFLAIRRGESEGILRARVEIDVPHLLANLAIQLGFGGESPWQHEVQTALEDAYRRLLAPSLENDLRAEMKDRSDREATRVFAENLQNLLLVAPLGAVGVLGVDPGLRTGCKCAVVAPTGRFVESVTLFLVQGEEELAKAKAELLRLVQTHAPRAIAVGNGTGGREAELQIRAWLAEAGINSTLVMSVNEAGASVYSASDVAREEFPELDLTVRGAISIARRLQDPLAELVKIDPKSIGVGQYQHDVDEAKLGKKLEGIVEACVNKVGVDLNTASAALLQYVAGVGPALAQKIVAHRTNAGGFTSRAQLLDVPSLGPKTFEQAAGFLRVRGGAEPLDASGVHPERYELVSNVVAKAGKSVAEIVGNDAAVAALDFSDVGDVGAHTLADIKTELAAPGRDPRATFSAPAFRPDVTAVEHLQPGMQLEGLVTNVTAFGAFVDIGVHQDGLVHVTRLAADFVKNPADRVRVGQTLSVRVVEVDAARKRISLSCLTEAQERDKAANRSAPRRGPAEPRSQRSPRGPAGSSPPGGNGGPTGSGAHGGPSGPAGPGPGGHGGPGRHARGPRDNRGQPNRSGGQPRPQGGGGPAGSSPRRDGRPPRRDDRVDARRGDTAGQPARTMDQAAPPRRDDRPPRERRAPEVGLSDFRDNPFAALLKK